MPKPRAPRSLVFATVAVMQMSVRAAISINHGQQAPLARRARGKLSFGRAVVSPGAYAYTTRRRGL